MKIPFDPTNEPRFIRIMGVACALFCFITLVLVTLGNTTAFVTGGISSAASELRSAGADNATMRLYTFVLAACGWCFTYKCWKDLNSLIAKQQKVADSTLVMLFCLVFGVALPLIALRGFSWFGLALTLLILPLFLWTICSYLATRNNPGLSSKTGG